MPSGAAPWRLLGVVSMLSLALVALGWGAPGRTEVNAASDRVPAARSVAQSTGTPAPFTPTGFGAAYDRAVVRMTGANHLLEARQAALFFATRAGAPVGVVADLRRQVATLEKRYAYAITAMSRAPTK